MVVLVYSGVQLTYWAHLLHMQKKFVLYINSQQAQNKYCKWRSRIEARIKDVTNVMFNINNKKAVQLSGGRKGLEQIIDKVKLQEEGCFQVLVILCVCLCPLLLLLEL